MKNAIRIGVICAALAGFTSPRPISTSNRTPPNKSAFCTCQEVLSPDFSAWLKEPNRAFFIGEVVNIKEFKITSSGGTKSIILQRSVTFKIIRSWTHFNEDQVIIDTGGGHGDCGYSFAEGEQYFVDAIKHDNGIETDVCTLTCDLRKAVVYIRDLDEIVKSRK